MRRRGLVVIILAAFTAGLIGASSAGSTAREAPKQTGPKVTVFSGVDWNLVAWQSDQGLCIAFGAPGASSSGCSHPDKIIQNVLANRRGQAVRVVGTVASNVARVDVKQPSGRVVAAHLSKSFPELETTRRFFEAGYRAISPRAALQWKLLAYDVHGKLLQHIP
jgi:hypothetical protein